MPTDLRRVVLLAATLALPSDRCATTSARRSSIRTATASRVPGIVISPYARRGHIDHQRLSFDAYAKFIEERFLGVQRLDPRTDGLRPPGPQPRTPTARCVPARPVRPLRPRELSSWTHWTQRSVPRPGGTASPAVAADA